MLEIREEDAAGDTLCANELQIWNYWRKTWRESDRETKLTREQLNTMKAYAKEQPKHIQSQKR